MGVDYQILGKNIKYYRKQKKLTQEQMAEDEENFGGCLDCWSFGKFL